MEGGREREGKGVFKFSQHNQLNTEKNVSTSCVILVCPPLPPPVLLLFFLLRAGPVKMKNLNCHCHDSDSGRSLVRILKWFCDFVTVTPQVIGTQYICTCKIHVYIYIYLTLCVKLLKWLCFVTWLLKWFSHWQSFKFVHTFHVCKIGFTGSETWAYKNNLILGWLWIPGKQILYISYYIYYTYHT